LTLRSTDGQLHHLDFVYPTDSDLPLQRSAGKKVQLSQRLSHMNRAYCSAGLSYHQLMIFIIL